MNEIQTIIPHLIVEKTSVKGVKYATIELSDGRKINTFDMKLADELHKNWLGKTINGEVEEKNGFYSLVGFEPVTTSGAVSKAVVEAPKALEVGPTREQSIVAQCLTKCFVEVLAANASMTLEQANTVRTGILETYKFYLKSL
jgi:hypothetical protein